MNRYILGLLLAQVFSNNMIFADTNIKEQSNSEWPKRDLLSSGFMENKFREFEDYVWLDDGSHKTDAVVIIKDGHLVYERYANGYTPNKLHMLWSLTKSLTSVIVGSAITQGILELDEPIYKYYPELDRKKARDIKLRHVLNMSSGFDFYEEHPIHDVFSDSVSVYYSRYAYKDVARGVSKYKLKYRPGTQFKYGTHEPMLAMGILKKAIGDQQTYNNYPYEAVFNKLGIKNITFEQDQSGTYLGGGYAFSTAREYAKIGQLILNKGKWKGEQILSEDYVKFATVDIAPALLDKTDESKEQRLNVETYGAYFWLNGVLPMNKNGRPYPSAPTDLIQAMGFRGQTMGVIPSENLVIVRLGSDGRVPKKKIKRDKMYKLLLASLKKDNYQKSLKSFTVSTESALEESSVNDNEAFKMPKIFKPRSYNFSESSAAALAKEMCSCLFVSLQPEKYCQMVTKESRLFSKYEIDIDNKEVHARGFGYKAKGVFNKEHPERGCRLAKILDYNSIDNEWHDLADLEYWQKYKRDRNRQRRLRRLRRGY